MPLSSSSLVHVFVYCFYSIRDVANGIWSSHPQTRRRHLSFHASEVISISPSLHLVESATANATLADVYEVNVRVCRIVSDITSQNGVVCLLFAFFAFRALDTFGDRCIVCLLHFLRSTARHRLAAVSIPMHQWQPTGRSLPLPLEPRPLLPEVLLLFQPTPFQSLLAHQLNMSSS